MSNPLPPKHDLVTTLPTPTRGLGVFTLHPIKPGTVLLRSKPILRLSRGKNDITSSQLQKALSQLSSAEKDIFLSLHENDLPYPSKELRIYKSNCFGDEETSWLSLEFSRLNHCCVPNAEITGLDCPSGWVEVVAVRAIAKGEEVVISYLGPVEDGGKERRGKVLRETYGFICLCPACGMKGEKGWRSEVRRASIAELARRQIGLEVVGGYARPLATPPTPREKVQTNFLLACLLQADGLVGYRLSQAWVLAAVALMGQMQDLKPLVIIPAGILVEAWLGKAVSVMQSVRAEGHRDLVELRKAVGVLRGSGYLGLVREVVEREKKIQKGRGKKGKNSEEGKGFATVFGQKTKRLSQRECIEEVRRMKG